MKKVILMLFTFITLFAFSCKKDADITANSSYDGKWSLVSYNPSPMLGNTQTTTYNMGDIVWDFNAMNQAISVSVNATVNNNPLSTGNYNYQMGSHACNYGSNQYFTTNNEVEGVFVLDNLANNKIKITAECLDGAILKFER